jgi:hypothetical protein
MHEKIVVDFVTTTIRVKVGLTVKREGTKNYRSVLDRTSGLPLSTVKKVVTLEGLQFNGRHGFNYIFIMEDADQNVFIYKGTSGALTDCYENDAVSLMATVQEHSERDGVKQTIIQRPKKV